MFNRIQLCSRGFQTSTITKTDKSTRPPTTPVPQPEIPADVSKLVDDSPLKSGHIETVVKFPDIPKHKVGLPDKIYLVWSKHYKSAKDIPSHVDYYTMAKARNWARIRINIGMLVFGVLTCIGFTQYGKYAKKQGQSLTKENLAWHKEMERKHYEAIEKNAAANAENEK